VIRTALLLLLLAGCAAPAQRATATAHQAPERWAAVLVAGDGAIPVFDNATGRMATLLEAVGTAPADIHRLSAAPDMLAKPHVQLASKAQVLDVIANLHPAPGQACFVYMTSHGAHGPGVFLAPHHEFLSPAELADALDAGCGDAPTVAIVSACYTGNFTQAPMTRPNRIVLTAAAADRPSFGCGAGQEFAFYDECLLRSLGSLPHDWPEVVSDTGRCVAKLEAQDHEPPSLPQGFVGGAATRLPVPG
jgi:hypothetical protein